MQKRKKRRRSFYYTSGVALTVIIVAILLYAVIYVTLYLNGQINGAEYRVPVGIAGFYCNQTSAVLTLRNNVGQPIAVNTLLLSSKTALLNLSRGVTYVSPYSTQTFSASSPLCTGLYNQTFSVDIGYDSYESLSYNYIGYRVNLDTSSTIS